jgi:hypothetical protein
MRKIIANMLWVSLVAVMCASSAYAERIEQVSLLPVVIQGEDIDVTSMGQSGANEVVVKDAPGNFQGESYVEYSPVSYPFKDKRPSQIKFSVDIMILAGMQTEASVMILPSDTSYNYNESLKIKLNALFDRVAINYQYGTNAAPRRIGEYDCWLAPNKVYRVTVLMDNSSAGTATSFSITELGAYSAQDRNIYFSTLAEKLRGAINIGEWLLIGRRYSYKLGVASRGSNVKFWNASITCQVAD